MRLRRTTIAVALAAAITVPTVATVTAASAARPAVSASRSEKPPTSKPAKAAKKIKFEASGTVTAVDVAGGTVTVAAKGGTKDVRGTTVTVSVPPAARIVVNGAGKKLADIAVGYRIAVTGTHAGTVYTATRVSATGKRVRPEPSATVRPEPSTTVRPGPSDDDGTPEQPEPSETPHA